MSCDSDCTSTDATRDPYDPSGNKVDTAADFTLDRLDRLVNVRGTGITITLADDPQFGDSVTIMAHDADVTVVSDDDDLIVEGSGVVPEDTATTYWYSPNSAPDSCCSGCDACDDGAAGGKWLPTGATGALV